MSEQQLSPRIIPLGFRIIGGFKVVVALLMITASLGMFRLLDSDLGDALEHIAMRLHLDPENRIVSRVMGYLTGTDRKHLEIITAGAFSYALLYGVEGVGLFLGCHWAEYLIVVMTGLLLPLEVYEIIHKVTMVRVLVFVANAAILAYLVRQLVRERKRRLKNLH